MFTGIVEEIGVVTAVVSQAQQKRISIHAKKILADLKIGDSVSVNGVCLTVTETGRSHFSVEAVTESLDVSNISKLQISSPVNLERALLVIDRVGGHIVTGHVDCVGTVKGKIEKGTHFELEIEFPIEFSRYLAYKGSIAVDGVSLTVVHLEHARIRTAIIPHTLKNTTLKDKNIGDRVNLEFDVLGKYIESLFVRERSQSVTEEMMNRAGFIPIGIMDN